jgi:hypothetical protein
MEKSQKLDEGVPRASDLAISAELIESASPIAFAKNSHFHAVHASCHFRLAKYRVSQPLLSLVLATF